jgi:hypothetical protein
LGYARPSISLVNGADRSPTSGGKEFFVDGDNFGPKDSAVHVFIEYANDFGKPEFEKFAGREPGSVIAYRRRFVAKECVMTIEHSLFMCKTAVGTGKDFFWRVNADTQVSDKWPISADSGLLTRYQAPVIEKLSRYLLKYEIEQKIQPLLGKAPANIEKDLTDDGIPRIYAFKTSTRREGTNTSIADELLAEAATHLGEEELEVQLLDEGGTPIGRDLIMNHIQEYSKIEVITITGSNFGDLDVPPALFRAIYGGSKEYVYKTSTDEFVARGCKVVIPHVRAECLMMEGAGSSHTWRLDIDGQQSTTPKSGYGRPVIDRIKGGLDRELNFIEDEIDFTFKYSTFGKEKITIEGENFGAKADGLQRVTYGIKGTEYSIYPCYTRDGTRRPCQNHQPWHLSCPYPCEMFYEQVGESWGIKSGLDEKTMLLLQDNSSHYTSPTLEPSESEGCVRINHELLECWSVPGVGKSLKFEVTVRDQTNAANKYATLSYADPIVESVVLYQSSSNVAKKFPSHWHGPVKKYTVEGTLRYCASNEKEGCDIVGDYPFFVFNYTSTDMLYLNDKSLRDTVQFCTNPDCTGNNFENPPRVPMIYESGFRSTDEEQDTTYFFFHDISKTPRIFPVTSVSGGMMLLDASTYVERSGSHTNNYIMSAVTLKIIPHSHCGNAGFGCMPAMQSGRPQTLMTLRLVGKNFGILDDLSEVRYFMESEHSSGRITPLSASFVQVNLFADPLKFDEASKAYHDKYFFSGPNGTLDSSKLVRVRCPDFEAAATKSPSKGLASSPFEDFKYSCPALRTWGRTMYRVGVLSGCIHRLSTMITS